MGCNASTQTKDGSVVDVQKPKENRPSNGAAKKGDTAKNGDTKPAVIQEKEPTKDDPSGPPIKAPRSEPPGDKILPVIKNKKVSETLGPFIYGYVAENMIDKFKFKPRTIKIYHSACLTDSFHERQALIQTVYPKLRLHCAEQGYELHVMDLHYGMKTEQLNDHSLKMLCNAHLKMCLESSPLTKFVLFLNDKLNTVACPPQISVEDFEQILPTIEGAEQDLISRWYLKDNNQIPPHYVLQPVRTHIQNYNDSIQDEETGEWIGVVERILMIFRRVMNETMQQKYLTTVMEDEISMAIQNSQNASCVYINRKFDNHGTPKCPASKNYYDLVEEGFDKCAQEKCEKLQSKLSNQIPKKVVMETKWNPESGINPSSPEHGQYLEQLCDNFETVMTEMIESSIQQNEEKNSTKNVTGVSHVLFTELLQHNSITHKLLKKFQKREGVITLLENYIKDGCLPGGDKNPIRPLILSGPYGCGSSSLAAMATKICHEIEGWEGAVCVTRFAGHSYSTMTMTSLLRSVVEHICVAYDLHPCYAMKGPKQLAKLLPKLLEKITAKNPLLVVLDGVHNLSDNAKANLSWLPCELPDTVRVIVTGNYGSGESVNDVIEGLGSHTHLDVPPMTPDELSSVMDSCLKFLNRTITADQRNILQKALEKVPLPLYVRIVSMFASKLPSYGDVEFVAKLGGMEDLIESIFEKLEKVYKPWCITGAFGYLAASQRGLTWTEINDLLSIDERVLNEVGCSEGHMVPPMILARITHASKAVPLMSEVHMPNGSVAFTWNHRIFRKVAMKRYDMQIIYQNMGKYYSSWTGNKIIMPQSVKYGSMYNISKLIQYPSILCKMGNLPALKEKCIFNKNWLVDKMSGCDVSFVLEDINMYLQAKQDAEVESLRQLLETAAFGLLHDPSQFSMQLIHRFPDGATGQVEKLRSEGESGITSWLKPNKSVLMSLNNMDDTNVMVESQKSHITGLFRLRTNKTHMVSVSESDSLVQVWDLNSAESVRTLKGVVQPKDVRMVDDEQAVILCNRELKVFNINTGTMRSTLKGVMNNMFPYFSVQDSEHVVSLSRNRMYVNIMKIETGDMEATFKVGEDRFLDSLYVSANGEMCVCGDVVQKPFPLLVWDLPNKKLIHDLRIPQHEFKTKMADITSDGHFVVCVCKELDDPSPNFLIVYDLQSGQVYKRWQSDFNTTAVAISPGGQYVINCLDNGQLLVWDMVGGACKHTLSAYTEGIDRISMSSDGKRCITYDTTGKIWTVKLWDVEKGELLGSFTPDAPITCCELSADGNAVAMGILGVEGLLLLNLQTKEGATVQDTSVYGDEELKGKVFDMAA